MPHVQPSHANDVPVFITSGNFNFVFSFIKPKQQNDLPYVETGKPFFCFVKLSLKGVIKVLLQ